MLRNPKWHVLVCITFIYVFLNISAFNTLGVVLSYMVEGLGWSFAEAGFSYTVLGVACGLGSLLPMMCLKKFGARWTMALGSVLLFAGYGLSTFGSDITLFYVAMSLVGLGFAMTGNLPALWIIGDWFEEYSARIIGFYMMAGAAGSIIGPPLVQAIVASQGWRFHWGLMTVVALICVLLAAVIVRERKASAHTEEASSSEYKEDKEPEWEFVPALKTSAFAVAALVVTLLLTAVTTISATATNHLMNFDNTAQQAAFSLGFFALVGTLSKGAAGPLCERFSPKRLLAAGAFLQGLGLITLAGANTKVLLFAWGLVFGMGWGASYVATAVLLIEFFGHRVGARLFAGAHILATLAALGPLAAGTIADTYGTFSPFFYVWGVVFLVAVIPILLMRPPGAYKPADTAAQAAASQA